MSDEPGIDADTLRQLYTTAPSAFVAARNTLAKQRRTAGDRAGATAIAALRKPSAVDVALNLVATAQPDTVASFLTAAEEVRDAQTAAAEGRSAASTRDALQKLRAETAAVVASAGKAATAAGISGSLTAPATARLGELVANEAAGDQLRAGHLGSGAVEAVDPFAGLSADESRGPAAPSRSAAKRPDRRAAIAADHPDAKADAKRRRLEEALHRAVAERDAAQHDHDEADRRARDAQAALAAAEARRREAQQELAGVEAARAKVATRLERADAAVTKAKDALDAA